MIIVLYILLLMNRTVEVYKLDYFVMVYIPLPCSTLISWLYFKITSLVALWYSHHRLNIAQQFYWKHPNFVCLHAYSLRNNVAQRNIIHRGFKLSTGGHVRLMCTLRITLLKQSIVVKQYVLRQYMTQYFLRNQFSSFL